MSEKLNQILTEALVGKAKGKVSFLLTKTGEVFFQSNTTVADKLRHDIGSVGKKLAENVRHEGEAATAVQIDVEVTATKIKSIVVNGIEVSAAKGSGCMLSKRG